MEKIVSSISGAGKAGEQYVKMELEHFIIPYPQIKSEWIKDLNLRPDPIKLLEKKYRLNTPDINCSNIFSIPPSRVMKIRTKINGT